MRLVRTLIIAALLLLPARVAGQTEVRASFEVRPARSQPELVAVRPHPAAAADLSVRVPAGWVASVSRGVAPERAGAEGTAAEPRRMETWTFVPL